MRVAAIVPAHNCEKTIEKVVAGLRNSVDAVIVIDDGSSDNTFEVAREAEAKVVRHGKKLGLGSALRTGFNDALSGGFDVVVTLDADGQHSPGDVTKLVNRIENGQCDMVIGSRLIDRSQWDKFPKTRLLGNKFLTYLTNFAAGAKVTTDSQSGYRAMTRTALEELKLISTHMSISSEIVVEVARAGFKIIEVPIEATYEDEVSYQRFFKDPLSIVVLLLKKRLSGKGSDFIFIFSM